MGEKWHVGGVSSRSCNARINWQRGGRRRRLKPRPGLMQPRIGVLSRLSVRLSVPSSPLHAARSLMRKPPRKRPSEPRMKRGLRKPRKDRCACADEPRDRRNARGIATGGPPRRPRRASAAASATCIPIPRIGTTDTPPPPLVAEPEPVFVETPPPTGLSGVFGGKKKHAQATQQARASFGLAYETWRTRAAELPARQMQQQRDHKEAEAHRQSRLAQERAAHTAECDRITAEVNDGNKTIDRLKLDLDRGLEYAVQEYIGIVLGKSIYPDAFPVEHDFEFDSASGEVTVTVLVPAPDTLPSEREFRYVKSRSEISSSLLPKTEQRQRYSNAVYQVALRTLYELFGSDDHGWVRTVALTVACDATDPATGFIERRTFVTFPADRSHIRGDQFGECGASGDASASWRCGL